MDDKDLIELAEDRLGDAYAPHSNYHVGAAVVTDDGSVYTGVNIENDNYTNTRHAEEVAIMKAVDDGHRTLKKVAVATEDQNTDGANQDSPKPCGSCQQTISQFIDESITAVLGSSNKYEVVEIEEGFQL